MRFQLACFLLLGLLAVQGCNKAPEPSTVSIAVDQEKLDPIVITYKVIIYEKHLDESRTEQVKISGALKEEIEQTIDRTPDHASQGAGMGLNTLKYLIVERPRKPTLHFQVLENEIILLDKWGVRQWGISQIEARCNDMLENARASLSK